MFALVLGVAGGIVLGVYALRFLQGFADWREVRAFRKRVSDHWDRAYATARWAQRRRASLRAAMMVITLGAVVTAVLSACTGLTVPQSLCSAVFLMALSWPYRIRGESP